MRKKNSACLEWSLKVATNSIASVRGLWYRSVAATGLSVLHTDTHTLRPLNTTSGSSGLSATSSARERAPEMECDSSTGARYSRGEGPLCSLWLRLFLASSTHGGTHSAALKACGHGGVQPDDPTMSCTMETERAVGGRGEEQIKK